MKGLTQARRDQARLKAQTSIHKRLGPKPERDQFRDYAESKFRGIQRYVSLGLFIVAIASGWVSAVRLYLAGYEYAQHLGTPFLVNVSIGVATPLAAEVLVIVATVAAQVYLSGWGVALAFIPVIVGMAVAFVGNWTITQPSTEWGWVEMAFPPLAVLSVAFIFEIVYVPELERREINEAAYQRAVSEWQRIDTDPELDEHWLSAFANLLRESLCQINKMTIDEFTPDEWAALVDAELRAEDWYQTQEFQRNSGGTKERTRSARKGLVEFVEGSMTQAERVKQVLHEHPELLDMSKSEASERLGVGMSTLYKGIELFQQNGNSHHSNGHREG
jgi:hypothetical protein